MFKFLELWCRNVRSPASRGKWFTNAGHCILYFIPCESVTVITRCKYDTLLRSVQANCKPDKIYFPRYDTMYLHYIRKGEINRLQGFHNHHHYAIACDNLSRNHQNSDTFESTNFGLPQNEKKNHFKGPPPIYSAGFWHSSVRNRNMISHTICTQELETVSVSYSLIPLPGFGTAQASSNNKKYYSTETTTGGRTG